MARLLQSLRGRFVLSHILPLLVIIPVVGIALVYVLETEVLVRNMTSDLAGMATIAAHFAADQAGIWDDPARAQSFVEHASPGSNVSMLLFDASGRLLASTDPADRGNVGKRSTVPDVVRALAGQQEVRTAFSSRLRTEVVAATVPVVGTGGRLLGVMRLTHPWTTVYDRVLRLRYLIATVLVLGMILGSAVGLVLALNLEQPLGRLTTAVATYAESGTWTPVVEAGPNEVRLLVRTVDDLVDRLRTVEQHRRQLLANLVHELGRPLGALSLAVQALEHGADQDVVLRKELVTGIGAEIGRLRRLLDDLARLYDQLAGTLQLVRRPTPLSDWLRQLLPVWRAGALDKGLRWKEEVPEDLPAANIDPDRLAQAVGNLLNNAIKYTPAGGEVCVDAGCDAQRFWVRVADTGPGIPADQQAAIFESFQRGVDGRRFPQGMGLGLTIARDLARAHGGRIDLDSQPGRGSSFTLWIPLDINELSLRST